jgi:hypothetical protein
MNDSRINPSKLLDGRIPAYQECPFRKDCRIAQDNECHHMGKFSANEFSCGLARAFDLIQRYERKQ